MLRKLFLPFVALIAAQASAQNLVFVGHLDASQEAQAVPVVSDAKGVGHFQINPVTFEFKGFINVQRLTSPVFGYHIHRGAVGTSGPIIVDLANATLYNTKVETKNNLTKITFSGTLVDRLVNGVLVTKEQILAEILSGDTYFNVHTPNYPAGEARGQISIGDAP